MTTTTHLRFLVTAGNTRERIDRVRDWGNIFTGNTGYSIARELARLGQVDLVTSNAAHLAELSDRADQRIRGFRFQTHGDLMAVLEGRMRASRYDAVFMTAAVSDYAPAGVFEIVSRGEIGAAGEEQWIVRNVQTGKVKSSHAAIAVSGLPTRKIVDCFRDPWGHRGLLIKFKLEVGITSDELIEIGQRSRRSSSADYLVANTLDMVDGADAGGFLLCDAGQEWIPRAQLPARLAQLIAIIGCKVA